ncbi:MAG: hypothetical protein Q8M09_15240, partial [Pseudomonadota bacterium]|nr:hypothetical protein [Pseudomonadota bacterium]
MCGGCCCNVAPASRRHVAGGPGGPRPPGRQPRRLALRQQLSRWDVKISPYLYISPFFVLFLVIGMFPLVYTAYVSLYDWSLLSGKGEFVGLFPLG